MEPPPEDGARTKLFDREFQFRESHTEAETKKTPDRIPPEKWSYIYLCSVNKSVWVDLTAKSQLTSDGEGFLPLTGVSFSILVTHSSSRKWKFAYRGIRGWRVHLSNETRPKQRSENNRSTRSNRATLLCGGVWDVTGEGSYIRGSVCCETCSVYCTYPTTASSAGHERHRLGGLNCIYVFIAGAHRYKH